MRSVRSHKLLLLLALACAGVAAPAFAQQAMYPGQDVTVNPPGSRGTQVLMYPGGRYMRVVPQLLEPGAPYPGSNQFIRLHMPKKHVRRKPPEVTNVATAPVSEQPPAEQTPPPVAVRQPPPPATAAKVASVAPPTKAKTAAPPPPKQVASSPPPQDDNSEAAIPFSLSSTPSVSVQSRQPPPNPPKTAAQSQQPPKQVVASVAPMPRTVQTPPVQKPAATDETSASNANLSKHGQIKFRKNATDLVPAAMNGIRLLANDLTSALDAGAQRVQLEAYGGPPGDKSSESRRLSLKRALTIRQLLIDNGVPSSRIDVRAMGGASDGGALDRVDVFVRA